MPLVYLTPVGSVVQDGSLGRRKESSEANEKSAGTPYVTGLRFHIIFGSLVLAGLLVALNGSMLGTVRVPFELTDLDRYIMLTRVGYPLYYFQLPHHRGCRLVGILLSDCQVGCFLRSGLHGSLLTVKAAP